jgi:hypothetical protein
MTIEARGAQGQMLFSGHSVTITRRGLIPFMTHGAGGTKTVPLRAITAVQHRRCGWFHGYLQLSVSGELEHKRGRSETDDLKKDENTVVFYFWGNKAFQEMADTLRTAVADAINGASAPTATGEKTPLQQLEELGKLRDAGYITPADYAAKKRDLLSSI